MDNLIYAGIGARATPDSVLSDMTRIAEWLARHDWILSSGGAKGADAAFEHGAPADQRKIYLPWHGYNGKEGPGYYSPQSADIGRWSRLSRRFHPAWDNCSNTVQKLHARNAAVILGPTLERPVDAVIAWTPQGAESGGTGQALRIASFYSIPIINLALTRPREACERLVALRAGDRSIDDLSR